MDVFGTKTCPKTTKNLGFDLVKPGFCGILNAGRPRPEAQAERRHKKLSPPQHSVMILHNNGLALLVLLIVLRFLPFVPVAVEAARVGNRCDLVSRVYFYNPFTRKTLFK